MTELPGISRQTEEGFDRELTKAVLTITPGPHVVFLCYRADLGFSVNENHYKWLTEFLAEDFDRFVVLVFGGFDELVFADEASKKAVDDLEARGMKAVFNADLTPEEKQSLMLETVDRVVRKNQGQYFSNNKIESAKKEILQRKRSVEDIKRSVVEGNCPKGLKKRPSLLCSLHDWLIKTHKNLYNVLTLIPAVMTILLLRSVPGGLS